MTGDDEARFRESLDERGLLRPSAALALSPPLRQGSYAVFAQRSAPVLDMRALGSNAASFFGAKLGLTVDKHYDASSPSIDAARVVVWTPNRRANGTRLCVGRRACPEDLQAVANAETLQGTFGMAQLARRCESVWLIACESSDPEDDPVALLLSAIFASVMLGPILAPASNKAFGVRTARLTLEKLLA